MKTMQGASWRAFLNRERTRLAPTPTKTSINSEPDVVKKGTPPPPAIALPAGFFLYLDRPRARHAGTHALVFFTVFQECHNINKFFTTFIDPRNIFEGSVWNITFRVFLANASHRAAVEPKHGESQQAPSLPR